MVDATTATSGSRERARVRALLLGGAIAGPLYLGVGLIEAFTRPGFDIRRHDLSLLANGDLGWIHVANLVVSGLLVIGGAAGMRAALSPGRGRTWGPLLVGLFGLGMVGGGFFIADPALGFPPGTPANASTITWHGFLHLTSAATGFLALVAGCLVLARRFAGDRDRAWAAYSAATGVVFLVAFASGIAGSGSGWSVLTLWFAVVIGFAWVTATCLRIGAGQR